MNCFLFLRPRYMPLPIDDSELFPSLSHRRRRFGAIITILFLASVIANIVLAINLRKTLSAFKSRPIDDYQHLNTFPLVADIQNSEGQNAVVTTLYNDAYASAVLTLGHSLRKVNTTGRMIVLYFPEQVSPSALCLATASGFEPIAVTRIAPPNGGKNTNKHFLDQFTKLSLWSLDKHNITSLVYLDADTLVTRNFDELFKLPYSFAAAPDVWGDKRGFTLEFNAGVIFLRPNTTVFEHMLSVLPTARFPPSFAEQAFLNKYFAGWTLTLPPIYNANLAAKGRYPEWWANMQVERRIIHYTMVKPFVTPQFKELKIDDVMHRVHEAAETERGVYREEMILWGETWEDARRTYPRISKECASDS